MHRFYQTSTTYQSQCLSKATSRVSAIQHNSRTQVTSADPPFKSPLTFEEVQPHKFLRSSSSSVSAPDNNPFQKFRQNLQEFTVMWFLSLSVFIAAMSVFFRGKHTELPLVAISTALLFALPNIRNSQPGVPSPVGTTEDSESKILLTVTQHIICSHVAIYSGRLLLEYFACRRQVCKNPLNFLLFFLTSAFSAISLLIKWIVQNKRVNSSIFEKHSFILNYNLSLKPTPTAVRADPENVEKPLLGK